MEISKTELADISISTEQALDFKRRKETFSDLTFSEEMDFMVSDIIDASVGSEEPTHENLFLNSNIDHRLVTEGNKVKAKSVLDLRSSNSYEKVIEGVTQGDVKKTERGLASLEESKTFADKALEVGADFLHSLGVAFEIPSSVIVGLDKTIQETGLTREDLDKLNETRGFATSSYDLVDHTTASFASRLLDNTLTSIYRNATDRVALPISEEKRRELADGDVIDNLKFAMGQENVSANGGISALSIILSGIPSAIMSETTAKKILFNPEVMGTAGAVGAVFSPDLVMAGGFVSKLFSNTARSVKALAKGRNLKLAGISPDELLADNFANILKGGSLLSPTQFKQFTKDVQASQQLEAVSNIDIFERQISTDLLDITEGGFKSSFTFFKDALGGLSPSIPGSSIRKLVGSVSDNVIGKNLELLVNQGGLQIDFGNQVKQSLGRYFKTIYTGVDEKTMDRVSSFALQVEARKEKVTVQEMVDGGYSPEEIKLYFAHRAGVDELWRLTNETYIKDLTNLGVVRAVASHDTGIDSGKLYKKIGEADSEGNITVIPFNFGKTEGVLDDASSLSTAVSIPESVADELFSQISREEALIPRLNNYFAPRHFAGDYAVTEITKGGLVKKFNGRTKKEAQDFLDQEKIKNPKFKGIVHNNEQDPESINQLNSFFNKGNYLNEEEAKKVSDILKEAWNLSDTDISLKLAQFRKPDLASSLRPIDSALARNKSFIRNGISGSARHHVLNEDATDIVRSFMSRKEAEKFIQNAKIEGKENLEYFSDFGTVKERVTANLRAKGELGADEVLEDFTGKPEMVDTLRSIQDSISQVGRLVGKGSFSRIMNQSFMLSFGKELNKIKGIEITHFTDPINEKVLINQTDPKVIAMIDNAIYVRNVLRHTTGLPKDTEIIAAKKVQVTIDKLKAATPLKSVGGLIKRAGLINQGNDLESLSIDEIAGRMGKSEARYKRNIASAFEHTVSMKSWSNSGRTLTSFILMGLSPAAGMLQASGALATVFAHLPKSVGIGADGMDASLFAGFKDTLEVIALKMHHRSTGGLRTTDEGLAKMERFNHGWLREIEVQEFGKESLNIGNKIGFDSLTETVFNAGFGPIRWGEWLNRAAAYSVALRQVERKVKKEGLNWSLQRQKDEAAIIGRKTALDFAPSDDPSFARGGLTGVAFALKKWPVKYTSLMYGKNLTKQEAWSVRLGYVGGLGGVASLPLIQDVMAGYDALYGNIEGATEAEWAVELADTMNSVGMPEPLVTAGLQLFNGKSTDALLGKSVTNRLVMGTVLTPYIMGESNIKNAFAAFAVYNKIVDSVKFQDLGLITNLMLGLIGQDLNTLEEENPEHFKLLVGAMASASLDMLSVVKGIGDINKGYTAFQSGRFTDLQGNTISNDVELLDIVQQVMGITPEHVRETLDVKYKLAGIKRKQQQKALEYSRLLTQIERKKETYPADSNNVKYLDSLRGWVIGEMEESLGTLPAIQIKTSSLMAKSRMPLDFQNKIDSVNLGIQVHLEEGLRAGWLATLNNDQTNEYLEQLKKAREDRLNLIKEK